MPSAGVYWKKERNIKHSNRCESARARFLWGIDARKSDGGKDFASGAATLDPGTWNLDFQTLDRTEMRGRWKTQDPDLPSSIGSRPWKSTYVQPSPRSPRSILDRHRGPSAT